MTPDSTSPLSIWLEWLLSRHPVEIDLGLERVSRVAAEMNLQRLSCPVISVAGTNGKGSSVAMLSAIYQAAGFRVGTYTSPHLVKFNERICINGQMVSDQQLTMAFDAIERTRDHLALKLTFFEYATLAALWVFQQTPLDVAILEVGLGGRLDAVNLVDADAALITAIGIDHIEWLGADKATIAKEKAGIMRSGALAVCSDPQVPSSLVEHAETVGAHLFRLGSNFSFEYTDQAWWIFHSDASEMSATPGSTGAHATSYPLPNLPGRYQLQNAAGVVALVKAFGCRQQDLVVGDDCLAKGLETVTHPGRLQRIDWSGQRWWVDVAHNPQAAEALAGFLEEINFDGLAVFAVLADKEFKPMLKRLLPFIHEWFLPNLQVERALSPDTVQTALEQMGVPADRIHVFDAMESCLHAAGNRPQSPRLVWGSLYTVGQFLSAVNSSDRAA